jgi:excisionase family DNA binding protein
MEVSRMTTANDSDSRSGTDRVYTTWEVARICKVAPQTVCKWFDTGRLSGYRIAGSGDRRIPRATLIRFLKEHGMPLGELSPEGADAIAEEMEGMDPPASPTETQPLAQPVDPAAWYQDFVERRRQLIDRIRDKDAFSTGEVAWLVQVAPRTVNKWFDAGRLGGERVGRSRRRQVPRGELRRFLREHGIPLPEVFDEVGQTADQEPEELEFDE